MNLEEVVREYIVPEIIERYSCTASSNELFQYINEGNAWTYISYYCECKASYEDISNILASIFDLDLFDRLTLLAMCQLEDTNQIKESISKMLDVEEIDKIVEDYRKNEES